jgi:hypothetical protein
MRGESSMNHEQYIDHEIRIRMLEHVNKEIRKALYSLIGIGITSIILPMIFHHYNLI